MEQISGFHDTTGVGSIPRAGSLPSVDILSNLRQAAPTIGGLARMVAATYRLSRSPGRLMPAEYFQHRLWDRTLMQGDPSRFVGMTAQGEFHRLACDAGWRAAADDKLLTESMLRDAGVMQVPRTIAVVHPTRCLAHAAPLRSECEIIDFLRTTEALPFVAKPVDGIFSLGVVHGVRYEPVTDSIVAIDGRAILVTEIARLLASHPTGYLVQRALAPAPAMAQLTGQRLCSVRALVLLTEEGPSIHRVVIKIPIAANMADNYWREGNRLGAVDIETGRINRVMTGKAATLRRDPVHPDTGFGLEDVLVPDFAELRSLVIRAASLFPGIRTQSWDIAVSDRGPVLLELNWGGDLHLHQIAHGVGILDHAFCDHLRACGFRSRLPA